MDIEEVLVDEEMITEAKETLSFLDKNMNLIIEVVMIEVQFFLVVEEEDQVDLEEVPIFLP